MRTIDNPSHDSYLLTATDETFHFLDKKDHVLPAYSLYFNHRVGDASDEGDGDEADEQLSEAVGRPPTSWCERPARTHVSQRMYPSQRLCSVHTSHLSVCKHVERMYVSAPMFQLFLREREMRELKLRLSS